MESLVFSILMTSSSSMTSYCANLQKQVHSQVHNLFVFAPVYFLFLSNGKIEKEHGDE